MVTEVLGRRSNVEVKGQSQIYLKSVLWLVKRTPFTFHLLEVMKGDGNPDDYYVLY